MPSPGRSSASSRSSSSGSPKRIYRPPLQVPTAVVVRSRIRAPTLGSAAMNCRLGVVALGDSITNGGGELQWGVALQSWALWTARGLGLPYTGVAVDGARAADVVARQLEAVEAQAGARWDLGCLYVGINDVRALPRARAGVPGRALRGRADRDVPARPRAPARRLAGGGNAAVERNARA